MNEYLDAVYQGKNNWWRYILSIALILFLWIIIGSIPVILLSAYLMVDGNPKSGFTETGFTGVDPLLIVFRHHEWFLPILPCNFHLSTLHSWQTFPLSGYPEIYRSIGKDCSSGFVFWFIIAGTCFAF